MGTSQLRGRTADVLRAATDPRSVLSAVVYLLGVALTLFTIYYAYAIPFERLRYSNLFLGLGLTLYYLMQVRNHVEPDDGPADETELPVEIRFPRYERLKRRYMRIDPFVAFGFAIASALATGYVEYHFDRLQFEAALQGYSTLDYVVGAVIIFLVTEATLRAFGALLTSVIVFAVAYAFVGPWMPSIFQHTGMEFDQVTRQGAIGLTGTYGFILGIGSTWVAIFIMFAGIAKAFGALDYVLEIGREMGGTLRTGVVQIAVVSSMIMGSITGSAAANTATTGSFTIPLIKDQGVRDDFAAAIEAVASSGGQMLPPIMGVAAFLMADIIGVPYLQIVQAGVIPATLFYFSVGVAVHLAILKFGWTTALEDRSAFDYSVFRGGLHFTIPLAVLLYTLVWLRFTPLAAGMWTIFTIIPVAFLENFWARGLSLGTVLTSLKETLDGLSRGAQEMAPLVGILGSLGVAIEFVTTTGLSQQISLQMVAIAGEVLIFLLLIAMIASILFGLGMPTPAAYILVAMLVVPAVIRMGVPDITAHMFVFYFAMLSAITPPVAVSVAIGSNIAGSNFLQSCMQALRIGAPGFLIPFAFVTNNSLIYWSFPETAIAFPLVLVGTVALVIATIGYDGSNDLGYGYRIGYLVLTFGALFGPLAVQVLAAVLVIAVLVLSNTGYTLRRWTTEGE